MTFSARFDNEVKNDAIQVESLVKEFSGQRILKNICFKIPQGQHCFLVGANGSGKTTLIQILSGLLSPTRGEVILQGCNYRQNSDQIRRNLFFVSHETFFYLGLTAEENLDFFYRMQSANNPDVKKMQMSERRDLIHNVLEKVSLYFDRNKKIEELSLGMRHRLSMARLVMINPSIILMDEPYIGLDQKGEMLLDAILLEKIKSGATVLEASHRIQKLKDTFIHAEEEAHNIYRLMILKNGLLSFDSSQRQDTQLASLFSQDIF